MHRTATDPYRWHRQESSDPGDRLPPDATAGLPRAERRTRRIPVVSRVEGGLHRPNAAYSSPVGAACKPLSGLHASRRNKPRPPAHLFLTSGSHRPAHDIGMRCTLRRGRRPDAASGGNHTRGCRPPLSSANRKARQNDARRYRHIVKPARKMRKSSEQRAKGPCRRIPAARPCARTAETRFAPDRPDRAQAGKVSVVGER